MFFVVDNKCTENYYIESLCNYKSFYNMLTKSKPKVSVLIPVFNAERFIADTITAVLAQTYTDFELILLDDASTDKTAEIVKSFTDERIVYVRNTENLGISANRNKLISMARGEYIAVLDHDDICLPKRLEMQTGFLDKHQDIAMIGSWFELSCPKTSSLWRRIITNLGWVWCHPLHPSWDDLWKGNVMMHPTIMYRRKIFTDLGINYRAEYSPAEDYDLVRQAMEHNLQIANLPQILLKYNLHGNNWSLVKKEAMEEADHKIKKEIAKKFGKNRDWFYPYCLVMAEKLRLKFMVREDYDV